jgi:hypothetical protein
LQTYFNCCLYNDVLFDEKLYQWSCYVDHFDAHDELQLEEGAEGAAEWGVRDLGHVDGDGDAEGAAAGAGERAAGVQHGCVLGERDQQPAEAQRHAQRQHAAPPTHSVHQLSGERRHERGAQARQRTHPSQFGGAYLKL